MAVKRRDLVLLQICAFMQLSGSHCLQIILTKTTGRAEFPENVASSFVDHEQIASYDFQNNKVIWHSQWLTNALNESWQAYSEFQDQEYRRPEEELQSFGKQGGMEIFQFIAGCTSDEKTGEGESFNKYGYNGEDFIELDMKNRRYIAKNPKAANITDVWNRDKIKITGLCNYYLSYCVEYLKKCVSYQKRQLPRTDQVTMSLFRKDPFSPVVCHATGFHTNEVKVSFQNNGEDHTDNVEAGETLPNGDGTFQKRVSLNVTGEEWRKNNYSCVVGHKSLHASIIKHLTEQEVKTEPPIRGRYGLLFVLLLIITIIIINFIFKFVSRSCQIPE